jgi:uncharacterized membrane protein YgcG
VPEAQPLSSHANMEREVMTGYGRSSRTWILKKSASLCAAALLVSILFTPLPGWLLANYPSLLIWLLLPAALLALLILLFNEILGGTRDGAAGSGGWNADSGGGDGCGGDGGGGDGGGGE